MESTTPNESTVAGAVNAPGEVTLYAPDGTPIRVAEASVNAMLRLGFSRERTDPESVLADLEALIPNLIPAWQAYWGATQAAGHIDEAAMDTAHAAIRLVAEAANRVHLAIHQRFGVAEEAATDA